MKIATKDRRMGGRMVFGDGARIPVAQRDEARRKARELARIRAREYEREAQDARRGGGR